MTNHFDQIAYYGNLDPLIKYGDAWLYGASVPKGDVSVPTDLYVIHEKDYNIISWKNSASEDMSGYYVYRSSTYGHSDIVRIAIVTSKDSDGNTQTCYIDYLTDSEVGKQYYYTVAAIDDLGYTSAHSDWNADINQDITYGQYSYLYTDATTQTYWNTLDLYKKLGNFDTDRNVVPFRDLGVFYKENPNGDVKEIKKDCNYIYATLLTLTDEQKRNNNFDQLEYTLFMDDKAISKNKPSILESAYAYESDTYKVLDLIHINKNIIISKFDIDFGDEFRQFTYRSDIEADTSNTEGVISSLVIDREKFFNKYIETVKSLNNPENEPNPDTLLPPSTGLEFLFNGVNWQVSINNHLIILDGSNNNALSDYGITYGTYSKIYVGNKIIVHEYWQLVDDSDIENPIYIPVNSSLDLKNEEVTLKDNVYDSYGISYRYNIINNNTTLNVELSRRAYIYFRVPYVYNSKLLQTYMKETGLTGDISNRITFKTYNYLIFPSVFGKIFNQKHIKLKELRGNLYRTDASNSAIYQNFGSYFDFVQPIWMGENTYRNCVLGTDLTAGLLDSGMDGGTFKGLKEVIYAYTQGSGVLKNQDSTKYLTVYDDLNAISNLSELPTIKSYDENTTYTQEDIICVNNSVSTSEINTYSFSVSDYTPADSNVELFGNGLQSGNQISVVQGATSLSGGTSSPDYIITDCFYEDTTESSEMLESNYFMYIAEDSTALSSAESITISDEDPDNPSTDDYYYNTSTRILYKYSGSAWEEYTSNLLCQDSDSTIYYYYLSDKHALCQLVQLSEPEYPYSDDRYYINVNSYYKNKLYSIPNIGDSRVAIRKLVGTDWEFVGYDVSGEKEQWLFQNEYVNWEPNFEYEVGSIVVYDKYIYMCNQLHTSSDVFELEYWDEIGMYPVSYTHNYIINTWNLLFTNWRRQVTPVKYLVYGNTLKLIGDVIYDPTTFVVRDFTNTNEIYTDYTVDTKTGYLTWTNPNTKPNDGSYVLISYEVDIRKDLIKLINLIKYPQVHINYIWEGVEEESEIKVNGLKFTSQENNSTIGYIISGSPIGSNIKYSYDGVNWNTWGANNNITLNDKEYIYIKGNNPNGLSKNSTNYLKFVMTGKIAASGNINYLLDEDNGSSITTIPNDYCFAYLFQNCTALTQAPELPATVLTNNCYDFMFYNCTSLTRTPELPAIELADLCYHGMFTKCTSLTEASDLPATVLKPHCYEGMFDGCSALVRAPYLAGVTLAEYCYCIMFRNCTSLNYIKLAYTSYFSSNIFMFWVANVAPTGDFYYNGHYTNRGTSAIPEDWTIQSF